MAALLELCVSELEDAGVAELSSVRGVASVVDVATSIRASCNVEDLPGGDSTPDEGVTCRVAVPPEDVESMMEVVKATNTRLCVP